MTGASPLARVQRAFQGRGEILARFAERAQRLGPSPRPLVVSGEPGCGRALLALALDARPGPPEELSGPTVTPAELGPALLRAGRGSLLIRELHLLSAPAQAALLQHLQAQEPGGARLLATVQPGGLDRRWFSPPLLERLAVLRLELPPLRAHAEALPGLFLAALEHLAPDVRQVLTPEDLRPLTALSWPGNLAEVLQAARTCLAWSEESDRSVRPQHVARWCAQAVVGDPLAPATESDSGTLAELERRLIAARLAALDWHQSRTAASLGIDRKTLYRKVLRYGIERPDVS